MLSPRIAIAAVTFLLGAASAHAQPPQKFEEFDKVVGSAKALEGMFKLYQKEDRVFAEIQTFQLDKPYLAAISLARGGMDMAGHTLNSDEQWVIAFKRVGDKVHVIRKNVRYTAGGGPRARFVDERLRGTG